MKKKTEIAIEHYEKANIKEALRIASEFRIGITTEERKQMKLGYECFVHANFYQQIGKDPKVEIERAIQLFEEKVYTPYRNRTA